MKKYRKKSFVISLAFIFIFFSFSLGYSYLNTDLSIDGNLSVSPYVNNNNNDDDEPKFDDYFKKLDDDDTILKDDGTEDHNIRYVGASPNNYVTFAGEMWRVIGVFNNIDDGTGKKETRVKIIKDESIGIREWHSSMTNIWSEASLNPELQSLPYSTNPMVDNAVWHLGDPGGDYDYTAIEAYAHERSNLVASGSDPIWLGKVGLMYPSDYGFASSACNDGTETLFYYDDLMCMDSNWLYLSDNNEWLLAPSSESETGARYVDASGYIELWRYDDNIPLMEVRPTVYLKSDVMCDNCDDADAGSIDNPFILSQ